ncbi:acyl-coenzyme A synthetase/AMP-(fatty) acid ligase/3-hydroxymyristoyl/3-hydroxydecanoyl-(acyl carrier protein) dehydratase [Pseudomonas sp. PvR086]|jgi:acyl-coenzyme A synthetase/AMP-(fatty) acid ligase/3-hydroxymyristoyl/3-hydroxydecanoyl-(acyl carrier protein) dehydratase|uniref:acyl-CoA synthetase family protein n=1 Tax=Pseudomonas TaxID=286 RepID=UPI000B361F4F|nr:MULTISPECIES: acyl-CoA synthetase family protein [Pseudomonas]MBD9604895.1 AMP-binding protein [Pseudomonas sp. PDM08]MDR7105207.1 acyl-coenzyme A synthetase/AMP-(fatty) acid ligase/3-hydroxymyristoyl/3-hydroxydecanoyl-(acyl carrier protein) dehydratase [Pseudomonas frederiksbergensis]PMY50192.1 AMP-binding protein [Pseudomonas sp. FW305-53]PMY88607.1 AMP-binding protein [Pseudomonas sp. FW303-C2]PMY94839.1 AMP-binding protein [Pseudomonas sp. FW305-62]
MNWIKLEQLLLKAQPERAVTAEPALNHAQLCDRALSLAAGLQAQGVQRIAVHLEDAADLAIALLGAWRAGISVLLPADLQAQTRQRWSTEVDLWLTDQTDDAHLSDYRHPPLPAHPLDLDRCQLSLCTSGSSGEPKRIDKTLRQLANEVEALEHLWGADLGEACIIGSVATQHIYGLLFRVLWPLCAGRSFVRKQLAFPEDLQRASREHPAFAWVASPALLKRMGDNLDWPALSAVRRVFSSGGALPAEASQSLYERLQQWPTEILGSSETGGIAWRQGQDLWQPFNGVELSQDSDGALLIASPYLPAGHIEHTADAARIAADGRFELLGRLDRIVKLEEKRISLPMLEHALMAHAWVAEARLGVVQENRASLGALLVLSERGMHALRNQGRRSLTQALRQHLSQHCETLALPRRWRLLRQLPLNAQGKLPQAEVEALLLAPRPKAPQVLEQVEADGEWSLQLAVPPDLAYFSGHFPRAPVLPGVVQVEWAMSLGQQLMDLPAKFAGMEVLKFQQLVRPGDEIQLHLRFDPVRGKLYFAYRNETATCSSGRILLEAASDA